MSSKIQSKQLSLETDLFVRPDATEQAKPDQPKRPKQGKRAPAKKAPPLPESQQPFLPGLSRRGRPRLPNPIPPTVRASESRRRRTEAGAKRVELVLDRSVADQLDALVEHFRVSRVEVIARLISKAAGKLVAKK